MPASLTVPDNTDPFTVGYQAVFNTIFAAGSKTSALVLPGNRNDLSDPAFENLRQNLDAGDLPELTLLQTGFELQPFGVNSRVSTIRATYPLVVATDTLRVLDVNAVKWAVYRDLLKAGPSLGNPIIRTWQLSRGNDGVNAVLLTTTAQRGVDRQTTLLDVVLQMDLDRAALLA